MKSKTELLKISENLDTRAEYASFYEFAVNYIQNMKSKKIMRTNSFFNDIFIICDNGNIEKNKIYLGISGKDLQKITVWCNKLKSQSELRKLTLDELHYVMGYCARRAKISSAK